MGSKPAIAVVILVLLSSTGCQALAWKPFEDQTATSPAIPKLEAPAGQALRGSPSATEAAQLCVAVAEGLEKQGHFREAALQLELARQHDPKLAVAARLGRAYAFAGTAVGQAEREKLLTRARAEYERALSEEPKSAAVHNDYGHFLQQQGEFAAAETRLRHALVLDPKLDRARMNLGLVLGGQGRYEEALAEFRKVVAPAEAHCNLAYVFLLEGNADHAREQYQKALQLDPQLRLARERLAALEKLHASSTSAAQGH